MIRKHKLILLCFLINCLSATSQSSDSMFTRLQAVSNGDIVLFNIDGIEIQTQRFFVEFSKKELLKKIKRYPVKESDLKENDSLLSLEGYYVFKSKEICEGVIQNASYYFIRDKGNLITAISFAQLNKKARDFERKFVQLIYDRQIPESVYENIEVDSINFAGRRIALGSSCRWMGVNNLQCPDYGQMNWSLHETIQDASQTVDNQFNVIKARKQGKIISEENVAIIFEGVETTAKRIIYDIKGINSLLVGISGGKTLTVYFVSASVRNYNISCVLSHWNNDMINPDGLPPLLEKIMKLKK